MLSFALAFSDSCCNPVLNLRTARQWSHQEVMIKRRSIWLSTCLADRLPILSAQTYNEVASRRVVLSTGFLFLSLYLSLCGPSLGRPLDHCLSLLSLAHRDHTRSFALHSLRTPLQVNIILHYIRHAHFEPSLLLLFLGPRSFSHTYREQPVHVLHACTVGCRFRLLRAIQLGVGERSDPWESQLFDFGGSESEEPFLR